jgi:hypothetical protein
MIQNPQQVRFPIIAGQTGRRLRAWLILAVALLPVLGWGWTLIDNRYVKRDEYVVRVLLDSINNVTTQAKLDTVIARITQIECGAKIAQGCR